MPQIQMMWGRDNSIRRALVLALSLGVVLIGPLAGVRSAANSRFWVKGQPNMVEVFDFGVD